MQCFSFYNKLQFSYFYGMQALLNRIQSTSALSPQTLTTFANAWQHWSVPKDYVLLKENTVSDYIYFVSKGVARIYYYKNGREITEWIAMEDTFLLSIISFFKRTPSKLIIHTVETSEIMGIHHDTLMELCNQHHEIERWLRKLVTSSLILSQYRMDSIQFEPAQQRYERLMEKNPSIIQRVPLSYIASFLGITQETLSRIRANR